MQKVQMQIILHIWKVLSGLCSPFINSVVSNDSVIGWWRFFCVEVLLPSQPKRVMSSAVSLSCQTYSWAGLVLQAVKQYLCTLSFSRNWQLPFLNRQKGENDHRKYFMINLYERMLLDPAGSNRGPLSHQGRQMMKAMIKLHRCTGWSGI